MTACLLRHELPVDATGVRGELLRSSRTFGFVLCVVVALAFPSLLPSVPSLFVVSHILMFCKGEAAPNGYPRGCYKSELIQSASDWRNKIQPKSMD